MRKNRLLHRGVQLDLFRPAPARPTWQTLPPEVTQRARQLLARLLQEHRAGRRAPQSEKEATDE
jgi:hypothetical protein